MKSGDGKADAKDIKKLIGSPKVIFAIGGPASGKRTQCEKLVEEFGYTHICTGDLMRAESTKGTKDGERIKKIMSDGGLVPHELTVQILINALLANPSKSYLIDGFPRATDQAQYFEQNVLECQQVLVYDIPHQTMTDRCAKRADTSGRADDHADVVKKRVQNFIDQTEPVIDYYKKFGKVRKINAEGGIGEVYTATKEAILPQTMFIVGPKASGKTKVAADLEHRTNMHLINFPDFVAKNNLKDLDDENLVLTLIQHLAQEQKPRVILESFPQNLIQAKYFLRNCKLPSHVFSLKCGKDVCQERMTALGEDSDAYVQSSVLSQEIKDYNTQAKQFLPYLEAQTNFFAINSEQTFDKTMAEVNKQVEPTAIHIRPGANSNDLRKEITDKLATEHGFINLDINALIRDENERKTAIGVEMHSMVQSNQIIPAEMIVRMLKKIIYCGLPENNKFILTSFPDIIDQAKEFEANCSKIAAIIYSTTDDSITEIKNNNLSLFNIDSMFQKENRLRTMSEWDYSIFDEKLGNKTQYGVVAGRPCSGKSELAKMMAVENGYQVIDMKGISEDLKNKINAAKEAAGEEPLEGDPPLADVEKIVSDKMKDKTVKFLFDGWKHADVKDFLKFLQRFGCPNFVLALKCDDANVEPRWKAKYNDDADLDEEKKEALKEEGLAADKVNEAIVEEYKELQGRVAHIEIDTSTSLELTKSVLRSNFAPRVILVNHEKRLGVDTTCSNLAIKFGMIYISVYQQIKEHIERDTEWGKKLLLTKRNKGILLTTQVRDEFNEAEYSPVHFDLTVVMDMLKDTIATHRTTQRFVLIEGLCNTAKLMNDEDKMELRFMDEFFALEQHIGEVQAVIGLQFTYEPEELETKDIEYEEFKEEPPEEPKQDETASQGGQPPVEAAPEFKKENYTWTKTNGKYRNLPQLFCACKPTDRVVHEVKTAEQFSSSQWEAISRSLDEFCVKVTGDIADDTKSNFVYQQIVFSE